MRKKLEKMRDDLLSLAGEEEDRMLAARLRDGAGQLNYVLEGVDEVEQRQKREEEAAAAEYAKKAAQTE